MPKGDRNRVAVLKIKINVSKVITRLSNGSVSKFQFVTLKNGNTK